CLRSSYLPSFPTRRSSDLIITMVFPVFGTLMLDFLKNFVEIDSTLSGVFQVLRWVFALLFISVFLFLLYRYAPNLNLPLSHVLRSEEHTSELQSRFDLVCR